MNEKINWFWAHRRNASLHHFSFLMHGLAGKGWSPAVNFWFDRQAVVGVPGKGCYVFYDKNQLKSGAKFKDIQESVDTNLNFVKDFRRRTDEIFGAIFLKCTNLELENLSLLSNTEILKTYTDFIDALNVAPLITVQPWGIEACLDDTYKISTFLRKRLQEIGKTREFEEYKGLLSVNTGETVAFTEKKNLYQVASKLIEHPAVRELFQHDVAHISAELEKYETENALFEKHAHKYEWVNTEYVSGGWTREQWLESFKKVIHADVPPHKKLEELVKSFEQLNNQRQAAIKTLNPPPDVAHAIDALGEFIAQRDWTKGYFTRSLLSYNKLLDEIARRLLVTRIDLLSYSYLELSKAIQSGTPIPQEEVESRKTNGFAFTIKDGEFRLVTGAENIRALIESEGEGISEPFEKLINISEFKGTPASAGHITAKARVIEDASMISELEEGEILVTYMTTIEFIPAFKRAAAVITDEGGMSCHAAIISREFRIPCVVGTKIATRVIQTGDTLEVDAARGTIKILK